MKDRSPEAIKERLAKLYDGAMQADEYLEVEARKPKPEWKPQERKYGLKIKGADRYITEAKVKNEVDDYIKRAGLFCKRINTQGVLRMTGLGTARIDQNPMKGMSDMYLCVDGISVWAELKKPTGAYTESQKAFIHDVIVNGGVAGIVTNVKDLERLIDEAKKLRRKASTSACKERLLRIAFSPQDYDI